MRRVPSGESPGLDKAKPACAGSSRQHVIRADLSHPCQSVFSSGYTRRILCVRVRAEALPKCVEAPAGLARVCGCGLKPSLSAWKPLRVIFRFRHQDAQTPPSPRVGEGGRGDEGQKARECRKPRIAPRTLPLRGECSSRSVRIRRIRANPCSLPAIQGEACVCGCGLKPSLSAWKPLRGWRAGAGAG
jgi:hypothetical protein